jgi:hypothetical protein
MPITYPDPFFEIRVTHLELPAPAAALCSGYDGGVWRSARLADHMFQWLPYAALNQEHQLSFGSHNFVEMLKIAASHIYTTKKKANRGELGELLLHLACVLHFKTIPVICKLILKTSSNETVKGFDGVHLLVVNETFELWLGESKFFTDPKEAIRDAVKSVKDHILPGFLATEKAMIIGHIAQDIPHRNSVVQLFKSQTSGDKLLEMAVFPVLIAYESKSVASFTSVCDEYVNSLREETIALKAYFQETAKEIGIRFQLIFVPMHLKADVVKSFDKKLEAFHDYS